MKADVFKALVARLDGAGFGPVTVELPAGESLLELPCVDVWPVAAPSTTHGLNVLGVDVVDVDVDLFVSRGQWLAGDGERWANELREYLFAWRDPLFRVRHVTAPVRRPDRNKNIRRYGVTIQIVCPA